MREEDAGGPPQMPYGIEVLVKKAAVDPEFRELLLARRSAAADEIGIPLRESEKSMLGSVPAAQLEAIIDGTKVGAKARKALLGKAAAVMLAALGLGIGSCSEGPVVTGSRPDRPAESERSTEGESGGGAEKGEAE